MMYAVVFVADPLEIKLIWGGMAMVMSVVGVMLFGLARRLRQKLVD